MLGPVSLRKLPCSHKLQNDARRAADGHLALLPAPDGAQITDAQQCGQLRLGEAVSLADGFDFGGGHDAAETLSTGCTVGGGFTFEGLHPRVNSLVPDGADDVANGTVSVVLAVGHRVGAVAALVVPDNLGSAAVNYLVTVGHFHSPLSGGALPRSVEPLWGTMSYRVKQNRAQSQIIFEDAAK